MALTDSLISHWKLNEASGTRNDSHGTNHMTDNNTVLSAAGKLGDAGDFEVDNTEYLTCADNASLSTGDIDFTVAAWVWMESKPNNNNAWGIYTKHGTSGNFEMGLIFNFASGIERFEFQVSSNGTSTVGRKADTFGTPALSTWYLLVAWHDSVGNTINIQVNNGTVDSTAHSAGVFDGNGTAAIGAYGTNARHWDGLIDSVSFWKRVLTTQERTDLYNSGSGLDYESFGGAAATSFVYDYSNRLYLPHLVR